MKTTQFKLHQKYSPSQRLGRLSQGLAILLMALLAQASLAQLEGLDAAELGETISDTVLGEVADLELVDEQAEAQSDLEKAIAQLRDIQSSLVKKLADRDQVQEELSKAPETSREPILAELEELNAEIELLRKTFEQIAIGGIDLSVFGVEDKKFDWREELVSVVKPLIENVRSLTEKPMKIESLRQVIAEKQDAIAASEQALQSIEKYTDDAESAAVTKKLVELEDEWKSRLQDLEREIQLAEFQLDSLEGKDVQWLEVVKQNLLGFVQGRGLTIFIAILCSIAIWALMRGLLWLARKRTSESQDQSVKVHYRLAAYAYRLLTGILISVAILMVLYFRQDLLLLAIMVVLFVGAALALKNLLPQYIAEGRILLNLGGVRERERVIYNGVPWQVSAINLHSRFVNPEIRGALRLPIRQMHDMISRPSIDDYWFPSAEGDWILVDGESPHQVVRQSVELVELKDLNSVSKLVPTAEYFVAGHANLSRAKVFRIAVLFGIDYATQTEDVAKIEAAFAKGIEESFEHADFHQHLQGVQADFHSAGDSSLNYLMLAKFDADAAKYYNVIKRRIQRACVMVCNENEWGIPFPQVSVHLPSSDAKLEQVKDAAETRKAEQQDSSES